MTSPLIFDRRTNFVTRAMSITDHVAQATPDVIAEGFALPQHLSELLMRHDGVCFSVYGENMVVPVLLHAYGPDGVCELVSQGAIRFRLQDSSVMHLVQPQKGVRPLASGRASTPAHRDPEASVSIGLDRLTRPPDASTLRKLTRVLSDAYVAPSSDYAPRAVKLAHDSYVQGRFAQVGLAPIVELDLLEGESRSTLSKLANDMLNLAIVADLKMETLDEFIIASLCDDSIEHISAARKLEPASERIFEIEKIPSFEEMFAAGTMRVRDVPRLRSTPHAQKFRAWMRAAAVQADASDVGLAYLDAIAKPRGFFQRRPGRLAKTLTVSAASTLVGGFLAGPVGAAVGAAAAPVATDIALDLVDEFVLDSVLKGWTPRNYFDKEVRPALARAARRRNGAER